MCDESGCPEDYEKTLQEWCDKGERLAFIYDYLKDKYKTRVERLSIVAFVLSSLTTLVGLGNIANNSAQYALLNLILKAFTTSLTLSASVCLGIINLRGWSAFVSDCQKYLDTIEHFVALIKSEQTMPPKYRSEPNRFLLQNKDKFTTMLSGAPDIMQADYLEALKKLEESKIRFRNDLFDVKCV